MDTQPTNGILEEFRLEFLECWQRLPNKLPFFVLLAAWVVLFEFLGNSTMGYVNTASLFSYMYNSYTEGGNGLLEAEESYALLIPAVVLGLFWMRRKQLLELELRSWWPGLLILSFGILLHLLGYCIQQPRLSVVGFFTGIYGIMGMTWGLAWLRGAFFPFFLLGFCVPVGSLAEPITFRMRLWVSQLVGAVCHYVLAIDVTVQGNLLTDPSNRYQYEIAAACSGIRSLIATFAFSVILAFTSFQTIWKRLVLIGSAFPLAILGNMLRMIIIIIAAEMGGQQWGNYVHEGGPGGLLSLLPYIPAFFGLFALERWLSPRISQPVGETVVNSLKLKET